MVEQSELFSLNPGYWLLQSVAMLLTALIIPRLKVTHPLGAFATVISIAFINSKVWDAALFFQVPDSFTLQALLLLLTNGVIFWIVVKLLPGIEVSGLLPAIAAPLVFSACSLAIAHINPLIDWGAVFDFVINLLEQLKAWFEQEIPTTPSSMPPTPYE